MRTTENLGTFCISDDKKEMMQYLGCDEKYNKGICSDFEFLEEWERVLPYCAGSESARLYEKQLSFLGISAKSPDGIRRSPIELWKLFNEFFTEENKCYFTRKYQEMMKKQGIDLFEYVMNIANEGEENGEEERSLSELLSPELLSELERMPHLRMDAGSLPYIRPDQYHASLALQRIVRGEKINEKEIFVLRFQLLIEALLYLKKKKIHAILHIDTQDYSLCEQMIAYLKENSLMEGEIRFSLFLSKPSLAWLPLCRQSGEGVLILPELVLSPAELGAPLAVALRDLATVYPIGGMRFGRVITDSESVEIVAHDEARERMEGFLLSEGVCDEKRQEILTAVFDS